jgi:hypothetical protein
MSFHYKVEAVDGELLIEVIDFGSQPLVNEFGDVVREAKPTGSRIVTGEEREMIFSTFRHSATPLVGTVSITRRNGQRAGEIWVGDIEICRNAIGFLAEVAERRSAKSIA